MSEELEPRAWEAHTPDSRVSEFHVTQHKDIAEEFAHVVRVEPLVRVSDIRHLIEELRDVILHVSNDEPHTHGYLDALKDLEEAFGAETKGDSS